MTSVNNNVSEAFHFQNWLVFEGHEYLQDLHIAIKCRPIAQTLTVRAALLPQPGL